MTGKLDRYVGKTVLGSYGACLLFMVLLTILVDLLLNLDEYLEVAHEDQVGLFELLANLSNYYGIFAPFVFVTIAPFVTVISGMFAVSRLMGSNELAPMLFTGRSMLRILRPVLYSALFSAVAMAACWEFVVPALSESLNRNRHQLKGESSGALLERPILKRRSEDLRHTLFCRSYDHDQLLIEGIELLIEGALEADCQRIEAESAIWNPELSDWELTNGKRTAGTLVSPQDYLGFPGLSPDQLWRTGKEAKQSTELSYSDLLGLIELRPGRDIYVLGLHTHITFPLANFVLLLLALPFAVHFERGSRIERVVFAILICALYLVTDLTCQNLVSTGLHPVLAAWLPTILFGSMGVVLFGSIRT